MTTVNIVSMLTPARSKLVVKLQPFASVRVTRGRSLRWLTELQRVRQVVSQKYQSREFIQRLVLVMKKHPCLVEDLSKNGKAICKLCSKSFCITHQGYRE